MNWWLIAITFIGVNLDFFFILLFLLKKYRTRDVMLGYLIGVLLIVALSYFAGQILARFLPEWILGVLGILPIWMALRDNDDDPDDSDAHSPVITTLLTYLAVCTGCNLSIFLPVLTRVNADKFLEVLCFVGIFTIIIVWLIKLLGSIPLISSFMEKYSENLMKVVYICVGLYVFWDSGLVSHLFKLL